MNSFASRSGVAMRSLLPPLGFLAAGTAVYVFFILTEAGQRLDASSFGAVVGLRESLGQWSGSLRGVMTAICGVIFLVLLLAAVIRQRLRDATAAATITALTLIMSALLKAVLQRPFLGEFGYLTNTFPSSRAAVCVAALVGSYWLLPDRIRRPAIMVPLLLLGSINSLCQVISYAHRTADIIGGGLLAGLVAALFMGRPGALQSGWRRTLWILVAVAAVSGILCLSSWEASGYATSQQAIATLGILLASLATVTAAFAVGAERQVGSRVKWFSGDVRMR